MVGYDDNGQGIRCMTRHDIELNTIHHHVPAPAGCRRANIWVRSNHGFQGIDGHLKDLACAVPASLAYRRMAEANFARAPCANLILIAIFRVRR